MYRAISGRPNTIAEVPKRTLYSGNVYPATLDNLPDLALVCIGGLSNSLIF